MQDTYSNTSFVFSVIDVEIAKTATGFLAFQSTYWYNILFACKYNTWYGLNS